MVYEKDKTNNLIFKKIDEKTVSFNNKKDVIIGYLKLIKIGSYNSWAVFIENKCFLTAGSLEEVRLNQKALNACQRLENE